MFTQDPENCTTRDVCQTVQPNTHDVNQGMHEILVVPITIMSDADMNHCEAIYLGQWQHQDPHETWKELFQQGKVFKDILQRIIFPARFEDAMPPECKGICMWYDGLNKAENYVTFKGDEYLRVQVDHSFYS